MRVVVAGGTGFLGSAIVPRLLGEGHEVVVLSRDPQHARLPDSVRIVRWDGTTIGPWAAAVDGAGTVINFTGESLGERRWSVSRKRRIVSSRRDVTIALVEAIRRAAARPGLFVSVSAVGYYGPVDEGDVTEDHPHGADFLAMVCKEWEEEARAVESLGVRLVIPRMGVVLGPRALALRRLVLPFRLFVGGPLGSGRQWFPWVHLDDAVSVVLFAMGNALLTGSVNVVAPEAVRMKDFCRSLARVLGRPCWAPVPSAFLRLLLGEMSGVVLTGQRAVPTKLLNAGYRFRNPALLPALENILGK